MRGGRLRKAEQGTSEEEEKGLEGGRRGVATKGSAGPAGKVQGACGSPCRQPQGRRQGSGEGRTAGDDKAGERGEACGHVQRRRGEGGSGEPVSGDFPCVWRRTAGHPSATPRQRTCHTT